MNSEFSRTLSLLRQEKGVSQRTAAGALGISQALLSHYEKGIREPGLAFVVRACDYYNVSADFILGRTLSREGNMLTEQDILNAAEPGNILKGSVLATLQSKLISGCFLRSWASWGTKPPSTARRPILAARSISSTATFTGPPGPTRGTSPWMPPPVPWAWPGRI